MNAFLFQTLRLEDRIDLASINDFTNIQDCDIRNDFDSCFYCKNQNNQPNLEAEPCKEDSFLKTGFKNRNKVLVKFKEHQGSKCHRAAVNNKVIVSQCANVAEMMNEKESDNMELNCCCLITILESLQYLVRQGLALHGNDDETSNFYQLLKLRAKYFPKLVEQLTFCLRWVNCNLEKFEKFLGFFQIPTSAALQLFQY